jgi:hypothetical protein
MKLAELQKALWSADPAAVLVSPRVLDRVIQLEGKLPMFVWEVPHRMGFVVDRHVLFRHVEQDELDLEPDRLLPSTVILLARPTPEELNNLEGPAILLMYWRRLFHAKVHQSLDKRIEQGQLSPEEIRERIAQIGPAEFEEIRMVLDQDRYLLRPADDRQVYVEFVAVFQELRHFAANLLPVCFPGITDFDRIDQLLSKDVDAADLFAKTRLPDAPDPVFVTDNSSDESHDYYYRLLKNADRASRTGNTVRAAILRTRAARVAPAALTQGTRAKAEQELKRLTARLQAALNLNDLAAGEWLKDLPALLDKADQSDRGPLPVEAMLLYDLQEVCIDHEKEVYALDLVEWLLSAGKRPIRRPLPSQRLVRIIKHLRRAAQRLTSARLSDADRQHMARLLQSALNKCEERLRERFRPILAAAMQDVGLHPDNPPEQTAFEKVIEELLDRIAEYGFLTFSDLRDTISRNQMKMPDLGEPHEFIRGDPLLRLDRRLAMQLDGVYRPGEFYLRLMERLTALGFGTASGRVLSRSFLFPFGGALLIIFAAVHIVGWFATLGEPKATTLVQAAAAAVPAAQLAGAAGGSNKGDGLPNPPAAEDADPAAGHASYSPLSLLTPMEWLYVPLLGLVLLILIHREDVRDSLVRGIIRVGWLLHFLLVALPGRLIRIEALRRLALSWPFQLFYWYLFKPALASLLVWPFVRGAFRDWQVGVGVVFLVAIIVLNSRLGQTATEAGVQSVVRFSELLRAGLLPGLIRLILRVFKQIVDWVESLLFTVDEWLRVRAGDKKFAIALRAILGVFWFPISFVARLYLVVLIEPGFNPIKVPLSILAAKFVYPALLAGFQERGLLTVLIEKAEWLAVYLKPYLGETAAWLLAGTIVIPTLYFLPDAFTFLVWEMKENWRLYRANRPAQLRPVAIGWHGETMLQLLKPGFHSGTIPRLYARLRQAVREAEQTGNWRSARTSRRSLQEVERTLQRFVDREFVTLLSQSPSWKGQRLAVGWVALASNRIRLELVHSAYPADSVWVEFEEHAGWLVAGIREPGWLKELGMEQRQATNTGLAGLYKLAGVDVVREQLRASLPSDIVRYDITAWDLLVWPGDPAGEPVTYDLADARGQLEPRAADGNVAVVAPVLEARQLLFSQVPLTWEQWVASWQRDQAGEGPPRLFDADVQLLPVGVAV